MVSIEIACVSLGCSVDDIWAEDHTSPPVRLLEVEYTLGDLGVYAEVLGGDGDRQLPSRRPDTRTISTAGTREHECDKIHIPSPHGDRRFCACDLDSVIEGLEGFLQDWDGDIFSLMQLVCLGMKGSGSPLLGEFLSWCIKEALCGESL